MAGSSPTQFPADQTLSDEQRIDELSAISAIDEDQLFDAMSAIESELSQVELQDIFTGTVLDLQPALLRLLTHIVGLANAKPNVETLENLQINDPLAYAIEFKRRTKDEHEQRREGEKAARHIHFDQYTKNGRKPMESDPTESEKQKAYDVYMARVEKSIGEMWDAPYREIKDATYQMIHHAKLVADKVIRIALLTQPHSDGSEKAADAWNSADAHYRLTDEVIPGFAPRFAVVSGTGESKSAGQEEAEAYYKAYVMDAVDSKNGNDSIVRSNEPKYKPEWLLGSGDVNDQRQLTGRISDYLRKTLSHQDPALRFRLLQWMLEVEVGSGSDKIKLSDLLSRPNVDPNRPEFAFFTAVALMGYPRPLEKLGDYFAEQAKGLATQSHGNDTKNRRQFFEDMSQNFYEIARQCYALGGSVGDDANASKAAEVTTKIIKPSTAVLNESIAYAMHVVSKYGYGLKQIEYGKTDGNADGNTANFRRALGALSDLAFARGDIKAAMAASYQLEQSYSEEDQGAKIVEMGYQEAQVVQTGASVYASLAFRVLSRIVNNPDLSDFVKRERVSMVRGYYFDHGFPYLPLPIVKAPDPSKLLTNSPANAPVSVVKPPHDFEANMRRVMFDLAGIESMHPREGGVHLGSSSSDGALVLSHARDIESDVLGSKYKTQTAAFDQRAAAENGKAKEDEIETSFGAALSLSITSTPNI